MYLLWSSRVQGSQREIESFMRDEEDKERELDRQYWGPLRAELEAWRRVMDKK